MLTKLKKYGFYTKGLVYAIIGILTFLAAINAGGKISDRNEVILFLEQQIFGKIILLIVGLGIIAHAIWRFYESFLVLKTEEKKKKYIICLDYLIRGFVYSSFGISILSNIFFDVSEKTVKRKAIIGEILDYNNGKYLLYIIGLIFILSGLNQFLIVYKNTFLRNIKRSKNIESFEFLKKTGKFGIASRGISFLIFGYFVFRASVENNPEKIRGTEGVFNYINELTFGNILLPVMALGFFSYGLFQYFYGRYSNIL